jgi:hypothetical protein
MREADDDPDDHRRRYASTVREDPAFADCCFDSLVLFPARPNEKYDDRDDIFPSLLFAWEFKGGSTKRLSGHNVGQLLALCEFACLLACAMAALQGAWCLAPRSQLVHLIASVLRSERLSYIRWEIRTVAQSVRRMPTLKLHERHWLTRNCFLWGKKPRTRGNLLR